MPSPSVSNSLPSIQMWPKKTFFGLDKGSSHCFTLPKRTTEEIKRYYKLNDSFLQTEIIFLVNQKKFPAQVRLVQMDRRNPTKHQKHEFSSREVIQFQWKRHRSTIEVIQEICASSYNIIRNGQQNKHESICFHHIGENEYFLSAKITD